MAQSFKLTNDARNTLVGGDATMSRRVRRSIRMPDELLEPFVDPHFSPPPCASDIFEKLWQKCHNPEVTAESMKLFTECSELLQEVRNGNRDTIRAQRALQRFRPAKSPYLVMVKIPGSAREPLQVLLNAVMPDLAEPRLGSLHDAIDRHFLPAGYVFVHIQTTGRYLAVS